MEARDARSQRLDEFEQLYLAYARAMAEAQLFESQLQMVAAMELKLPRERMSPEQMQERTEWFFSRPIHWLQQRLDLPTELTAEIEALRHERNHLAHNFFNRIEFTWPHPPDPDRVDVHERLPEHLRLQAESDGALIAKENAAERARATAELLELRERFHNCWAKLSERWMSHIPFASSWEEAERSFAEAMDDADRDADEG